MIGRSHEHRRTRPTSAGCDRYPSVWTLEHGTSRKNPGIGRDSVAATVREGWNESVWSRVAVLGSQFFSESSEEPKTI
jgi:hypothetical protein